MKDFKSYAVIALALLAVSLILSQNANPDNPFFNLKRVEESGILALKFTPKAKVDYLRHLLDVRFSEFESLIKAGGTHDMWSASLRYSTYAGLLTDLITANHLKDQADAVKKKMEAQREKLNQLYVAFPKNTDNGEWKYILDAINYLNFNLDKLSKI